MKLKDAQGFVRELEGKSYWYLKEWGISTVKEAIRTIWNRKGASRLDHHYAGKLFLKISEGER